MDALPGSGGQGGWSCFAWDGRRNRRGKGLVSVTPPQLERQKSDPDDNCLTDIEHHLPLKSGIHKAVRMQANPQHIYPEPREGGHDVAENREIHNPPIPNESSPARVENNGVPKDDEQCSVLLGIPAPESAPGLIGPDATQHSPDKTEQGCETDHAVNHPGQDLSQFRL